MAELGMRSIDIPAILTEKLISMAKQASPLEICGILAGKFNVAEHILPIRNISHDPNRYQMDPQEQIHVFYQLEQLNLERIAFYHSHPQSEPAPSPTDLAEWSYPEIPYLIIGQESERWNIHGYQLSGKRILKIELKIS